MSILFLIFLFVVNTVSANSPNTTDYSKYVTGVEPGGSIITNATQGSCLRNREYICGILQKYLTGSPTVFEVGTGTADQTVYFCEQMPNVIWQTSDLEIYHEVINETLKKANLPKERLKAPVPFDIDNGEIEGQYDVIYSSNVIHCIPMKSVETLFKKVSSALKGNGLFILYGPYNMDGKYTSEGNQNFDQKLKAQDARLGLRDIDEVSRLAEANGMVLEARHDHKAANNNILVFKKLT